MFCNSSARASIPSRALISFSRVLMVFSLKVSFQSSNNRKSYHRSPGAPLAFTPAIRCNLSAHLQLSSGDVRAREFSFLRPLFEKEYLQLHRRPVSRSGFGDEPHAMGACFPGHYRLFVKARGDFQICEKSNDSLIIGNVNDGLDLRKICEIYEKYFALHNRECKRCWAYQLCPSCYVSSTRDGGRFQATLDSSYCNRIRKSWRHRLSNYCATLKQNPKSFEYLGSVETYDTPIPVLDSFERSPTLKPLSPV